MRSLRFEIHNHVASDDSTIDLMWRRKPTLAVGIPTIIAGTLIRSVILVING